MTRNLGDYVSAIHGAALPLVAAATQAAPKVFVASLRTLQTMGLPFYGAVALLACGCALVAFLAIWLTFRGIANALSAVGHGIANGAAAARHGLGSLKLPAFSLPKPTFSLPKKMSRPFGPAAGTGSAESFARESRRDESFVPAWDPAVSIRTPDRAAPEPDPVLASPIGSLPSRPTPASVEAAAFGGSPRFADIADPLVQEEVPPGFLYVDTGISGGAGTGAGRPAQPAYPVREESAQREAESPAGTPLAAPAPFPPRPSASAMTIDEAIRLATELQEGGEHGAPRANGREGRSAVAS